MPRARSVFYDLFPPAHCPRVELARERAAAMETVKLPLIWLDGRTRSMMQDIDDELTEIVVGS